MVGNHQKKNSKKKLYLFVVLLFALEICLASYCFYLKCNNCNIENDAEQIIVEKDSSQNKIVGSWTTDGYTEYDFYENGRGCLKIPIADYEFTYTIKNNMLHIDFDNESSEDSDYEFSFENSELKLKSINGTFIFTKK